MAQLKSGTRIYGDATVDNKLQINGVLISGTNGIVTSSNPGVTTVTYYGDGSKLSNIISGVSILQDTTNQSQYLTFVTGTGSTSGFGITTGLIFNPSTVNLGIGTTSPGRNLHVQGDVRITGAIYAGVGNTSGNNLQVLQSTGTGIQWVNTPTPSAAGSPGQIQFNSAGVLGGTPYFYYDTAKVSIGIGTTLPTGRLSIANTSTGGSLLLVNDNISDGTLFRVSNNLGTALFDVDADTSITMGQPNTRVALQVNGDAVITGILTAKVDGTVTGAAGTTGQVQFNANGKFAGAPYFHYDASKISVSIGSSTPTGRLSIANASTGNSLLLVNDNVNDGSLFRVNDNSGFPLFDVDAGGAVVFNTSGNVGIGTDITTPTNKLQVSGNMSVSGVLTATTYGPITSLSSISASTTLRAGLGTFLSATSTGLGIGTANPTAKLQVVGASNTSLLLVNENLSDGSLFRVADAGANILFDVDANSSIVAPICNNFGIGVFTPTAVLHLRGGTATVSTAPLKFTSGTNLTTAEVGAVEYDGSFLYQTPNSTSGRGYIPPTYSFRLTANGTAIGSAIADFFTTPSSLSLEASSVYKITCFVRFLKSTDGTATWTQTFSSAPTVAEGYHYTSPVGGTLAGTSASYTPLEQYFYDQGVTTFAWTPSGTNLSSSVNHFYRLEMTIVTSAATNWRLRLTQGAGTATPLAGSYYKIEKISSSTGTFVA
jgi:hypothetical protein